MASLGPRVVLDTNVVISSHWGGLPRRVLEAWGDGRFHLVTSKAVLAELARVLARIRNGDWEDEKKALAVMEEKGFLVEPRDALDVVRADPSDNRFLECAVEGRADYLVSGDAHLLNLREFRWVKILTPRAFLDMLSHRGD